jgi:type I pantothenate kinase
VTQQLLDPVVSLVRNAHVEKGSTLVLGVSGGVAVGKSTFSESLTGILGNDTDLSVAVVSSDGFLFPNAALAELGIADRKGFPESYDVGAIVQFLTDVHDGQPTTVPVYNHHTYDITGTTDDVPVVDVMVFEGVNALQFHSYLDVGIYLHADEPILREWFITRTSAFREAARRAYSPFFDPWIDVPDELFLAMVNGAWETVNLPNLVNHIEPTKSLAHVVIEWEADHSIRAITMLEKS